MTIHIVERMLFPKNAHGSIVVVNLPFSGFNVVCFVRMYRLEHYCFVGFCELQIFAGFLFADHCGDTLLSRTRFLSSRCVACRGIVSFGRRYVWH